MIKLNEEEMKKLDDNFEKITKQYNMLNKKIGLEDNCRVKRFFVINNRYLISEYKKLSAEYSDLLKKELEAKKSDMAELKKLSALQVKYKSNFGKIKLAELKTPLLEVLLIAFILVSSFIITYLCNELVLTKIAWSLVGAMLALVISYNYSTKTTLSLKWLNVICSILSGSLSILTFIFPESNKLDLISAIIIFYLIVQAFINWEEANIEWKDKVLQEVKQIE